MNACNAFCAVSVLPARPNDASVLAHLLNRRLGAVAVGAKIIGLETFPKAFRKSVTLKRCGGAVRR